MNSRKQFFHRMRMEFFSWFAGGKLNISYLLLDAHIVDQLNEAQPKRLQLEPFATIGRTV